MVSGPCGEFGTLKYVHDEATTSELVLSIVLPCLNEAETLEFCIKEAHAFLDQATISGEVVVADNGSTDASAEIARHCGARVVEVPERGYGAALSAGIAAANGRYVAMGDADGSYDFMTLGPFLVALEDGADLVMGDRFAGGIEEGAMPWLHRRLGNPVLSQIGRWFFSVKVHDFHCGLRAFRRDRIVALNLGATGMEFASEMVARAAMEHYRIDEVSTVLRQDRRSHPPHLRTWRDGWRHLRFLLLYSPRWLFFYPGLALLVLGLVLGTLIETNSANFGQVTLDVDALVAALGLVLIGTQAILLHVLTAVFSARIGLRPLTPVLARLVRGPALERGILLSGLLALAGIILFAIDVVQWKHAQFGQLDASAQLRLTIPAIGLIVLGIQGVMNTFFLGVLGIQRQLSRAGAAVA